MVKYGHYLAALERDSAGFQGKFLQYKQLKKRLKACQAAGPPPSADPALDGLGVQASADEQFFSLLDAEMARVDAEFLRSAEGIVSSYQRAELRRRLACCLPCRRRSPARLAALAERAYWCRKYARANGVAVRKILKKYDKLRGGRRGRDHLAACWRLATGAAFLHSPLLDELKAIQELLQAQQERWTRTEDPQLCEVADTPAKAGARAAPQAGASPAASPASKDAKLATPAFGSPTAAPALPRASMQRSSVGASSVLDGCCASHTHLDAPAGVLAAIAESPSCMLGSTDVDWEMGSGGAGGGARSISTARSPLGSPTAAAHDATAANPGALLRAASKFYDEELRCPICLDALYKPVGLACGHRFCKACALDHAGLGRSVGTFANLCSYVSSQVACPQCRQPRVYAKAHRLRRLDRVVKSRFPDAWEERRREEKEARSAAVVAAAEPGGGRHWMHTVNAHDALLSM